MQKIQPHGEEKKKRRSRQEANEVRGGVLTVMGVISIKGVGMKIDGGKLQMWGGGVGNVRGVEKKTGQGGAKVSAKKTMEKTGVQTFDHGSKRKGEDGFKTLPSLSHILRKTNKPGGKSSCTWSMKKNAGETRTIGSSGAGNSERK